jgi:Ca-activated chloride channel family protein
MSLQLGQLVFLQPLWLVVAAILALSAVFIRIGRGSNDWSRVIAAPVLDFLGGQHRKHSHWNMALLAATLVALSLSQPVIRQSDDETWRHSTGWIVLADVSRSMTLTDVVPSRLSALRVALAELSESAGARPISLILYAGDAFMVAPPAFDKSVFDEHAALLEHGVIPIEGSNLARALSLASSVIQGSQFINARVLLLTDSGGISKGSIAAAHFLADAGHQLDVLLFGTIESAQVDDTDTAVDAEGANSLAESGNGRMVASDRFGVINYSPLRLNDQADPSTHSELKSLVWRLQSHWLMLLALPLLLKLFKDEMQP